MFRSMGRKNQREPTLKLSSKWLFLFESKKNNTAKRIEFLFVFCFCVIFFINNEEKHENTRREAENKLRK